jgi:hypothetical protein
MPGSSSATNIVVMAFHQIGLVGPEILSCFNYRSPSRPGEFHPEPLTEPDLILSHHPARATHRRLPSSAETHGLLRSPVGPSISARVTRPLRSIPITGTSPLLRGSPPLTGASVFQPCGSATCAFSLNITSQVLKFRALAWMRVTPPAHRTPRGQ